MDFHPVSESRLPAIHSVFENLLQQRKCDEDLGINDIAVGNLSQASTFSLVAPDALFQTPSCKEVNAQFVLRKTYTGVGDGPLSPTSFDNACSYADWAKAIDKKYSALIQHETWTYIQHFPEQNYVPFKWVFKA